MGRCISDDIDVPPQLSTTASEPLKTPSTWPLDKQLDRWMEWTAYILVAGHSSLCTLRVQLSVPAFQLPTELHTVLF